MAKVKDFATVRVSGPEEWRVIREAYAETYPVRPLLNHIDELTAALQAVKLRMHFIGWPAESFWSPNDDGRTIPDWRKEIALVEHALTGCVLPGFPAAGAKP